VLDSGTACSGGRGGAEGPSGIGEQLSQSSTSRFLGPLLRRKEGYELTLLIGRYHVDTSSPEYFAGLTRIAASYVAFSLPSLGFRFGVSLGVDSRRIASAQKLTLQLQQSSASPRCPLGRYFHHRFNPGHAGRNIRFGSS
jgi:hypothetical protein